MTIQVKIERENRCVNVIKIFVSHQGGTICMEPDENGDLVPARAGRFQSFIENEVTLHDKKFVQSLSEIDRDKLNGFLVLPPNTKGYLQSRVAYKIESVEELLDSTNMEPGHWLNIGNQLVARKSEFDAFVILTGTDTMAYGASILSFTLLGHLAKMVVLTGSQLPIFEEVTDGKTNIWGALTMAAIGQRKKYQIQDICIFFHEKLLRGNRAVKYDANHVDAFAAPNMHHLARIVPTEDGIIKIKKDALLKFPKQTFPLVTSLNTKVGSITINPYMIPSPVTLRTMIGDMKGVVVRGLGNGNIPRDLLKVFHSYSGVLFVLVSQCVKGRVQGIYKTGRDAIRAGLVSGLDMTTEAALAKLAWVLSLDDSFNEKIRKMETNIWGELTEQEEHQEPSDEVEKEETEGIPDGNIWVGPEDVDLSKFDEVSKEQEDEEPTDMATVTGGDDDKELPDFAELDAFLMGAIAVGLDIVEDLD